MNVEIYIKRYIEVEKKRLALMNGPKTDEFFDVCDKCFKYEKKLISLIGMDEFTKINNNI